MPPSPRSRQCSSVSRCPSAARLQASLPVAVPPSTIQCSATRHLCRHDNSRLPGAELVSPSTHGSFTSEGVHLTATRRYFRLPASPTLPGLTATRAATFSHSSDAGAPQSAGQRQTPHLPTDVHHRLRQQPGIPPTAAAACTCDLAAVRGSSVPDPCTTPGFHPRRRLQSAHPGVEPDHAPVNHLPPKACLRVHPAVGVRVQPLRCIGTDTFVLAARSPCRRSHQAVITGASPRPGA